MKPVVLPPALIAARQKAQARWAALARRERQMITTTAIVCGLGLVWMVAVQPAWRSLRDSPAQIDLLDSQLQQMQRLAAESRELRAMPAVRPSQAEQALRGATERLGPSARLTMQGDRATLTLTGVSGQALAQWLGEARSAARARPDEVKLSRGPTGYTGSIVLSLTRAG